jgi:hypothetical protein
VFHALLALLNECVLFPTTFIGVSNASSVHIPFLHVVDARFNLIVNVLLVHAGLGGDFFLSIECRSNMLLCHLWSTIKFLEVSLVPTSKKLVAYILNQSWVCLFFSYTQPKNPKNVVSLEIELMHALIYV